MGPATPVRRVKLQFSLMAMFLLLLVCGILAAWWKDRTALVAELDASRVLLDAIRRGAEIRDQDRSVARPFDATQASAPPSLPNRCATPEEFIKALREIKDWYDFADKTADPFVKTPIADKALPLLIDLLNDPDAMVRTRALATLGKMQRSGDVIVPAVIPLLQDEEANVRWHAAFALGSLGPNAKVAIPDLRRQMNDDSSPIAAFAGEMLRGIDPRADVAPRLVELLQRGQGENRLRALHALSRIADRSLLPALTNAYRNEKNAEFRDRIAGLISQIDGRREGQQGASP